MRFEIDALKIYESLSATDKVVSPQDELTIEFIKQIRRGEEWRGEKETDKTPAKVSSRYRGADVKLPNPFDFVYLQACRNGDLFDGSILVYTHLKTRLRGFDFDGLSEKMASVYGDNWYATDNNGSGYVLDSGTPRIVIQDNPYASVYHHDINIGRGGADARRFGSVEEFVQDMCEWQQVASVLVSEGLELAHEKMGITLPPANLLLRL